MWCIRCWHWGGTYAREGQPLAYLSKALAEKHLKLSIYDKEMLAIVFAISKWHPYLLGRHFKVLTDHCTLKYFLDQRLTTMEQQKWLTKLLGYDYEILYRKRKDNSAADALSCIQQQSELMALSTPLFTSMPDILNECSKDAHLNKIAEQLLLDPSSIPHYSMQNGILRYKGRIVLPSSSPWCIKILHDFHHSPLGGHSGFLPTYQRISRNFYWKGIKQATKKYVAECDICQRMKAETMAPPGLLQPLPIPAEVWVDLSMDFIDGLPPSNRKSSILVVVNRFSKYAHFSPIAHPYAASSVAETFVRDVVKLHGMPRSIVSDRDPIFISQFWEAFFTMQGTKLCRSSAYHPQTDGQTKVVNRYVEQYLRCFVGHHPNQWTKWLPWAEF